MLNTLYIFYGVRKKEHLQYNHTSSECRRLEYKQINTDVGIYNRMFHDMYVCNLCIYMLHQEKHHHVGYQLIVA